MAASSRIARDLGDLALVACVAAGALAFGWTGFLASDDLLYASSARSWLDGGARLGDSFGSLRHTVVLPIALSFAAFGVSEQALVLPTLVYFAALLALTYAGMRASLGRFAGVTAGLLLATTPLFPLTATLASADIAELLFIALALWALWQAGRGRNPRASPWVAGAAGGLALLTRETSAVLILYFGLLSLFGRRVARRVPLTALVAAALTVALELLYLGGAAGDPFYRLRRSFVVQRQYLHGTLADTGNMRLNPVLDPLLVLLLNQEFALLFWCALPAGAWAAFATGMPERVRSLARHFGGFGALWFASVALNPLLRPLPRYFAVAAYAAVLLAAAWLALVRPSRPRLAASVTALLLVSNLLGIYVDNRDFLFGARALVRAAAASSETVYTDPETARAAAFLLVEAELSDRVSSMPPPPGALYFHDPKALALGASRAFDPASYTPRATWAPVLRVDPGRKLTGRIIERLGIDRIIPAQIFAKLDHPNSPVVLYRVGPS